MIPVGIKIFKLIINQFANELEKDELADDEEDEEDEVGSVSSFPVIHKQMLPVF